MSPETVISINNYLPSIVCFHVGNPFQFKQTVDREMQMENSRRGAPGQGPHRDPRDAYILVATVTGIIICCTIGVVIGVKLVGYGGIFLGLVAGVFIGGFAGLSFGDYLKKRHIRKNLPQVKKEDEGPFIK